jgi:hypothetical protein
MHCFRKHVPKWFGVVAGVVAGVVTPARSLLAPKDLACSRVSVVVQRCTVRWACVHAEDCESCARIGKLRLRQATPTTCVRAATVQAEGLSEHDISAAIAAAIAATAPSSAPPVAQPIAAAAPAAVGAPASAALPSAAPPPAGGGAGVPPASTRLSDLQLSQMAQLLWSPTLEESDIARWFSQGFQVVAEWQLGWESVRHPRGCPVWSGAQRGWVTLCAARGLLC